MPRAPAQRSTAIRLVRTAALALGFAGCRLTPFSETPSAPVTESPVAAQTVSREAEPAGSRGSAPQAPAGGGPAGGERAGAQAANAPSNGNGNANGNANGNGNANANAPASAPADVGANGNAAASTAGGPPSAADQSAPPPTGGESGGSAQAISSVPQPALAPPERVETAAGNEATVVPPSHPGPQPVVAVLDARCVPPTQRCGDAEAGLRTYGWVVCVPTPTRCDGHRPAESAPSLAPVLSALEARHAGEVARAGVLIVRGTDTHAVAEARSADAERWPFVVYAHGRSEQPRAQGGGPSSPGTGAAQTSPDVQLPMRVAIVSPAAGAVGAVQRWADTLRQQGTSVSWMHRGRDGGASERDAVAWVLTGLDFAGAASQRGQ